MPHCPHTRPTASFFTIVSLLFALAAPPLAADEGMWPFHNIPAEQIEKKYGVKLTAEWLSHLRLSAARFGSSSGFVSPKGLLLTNHHVARGCIQRLSTQENDLARNGFLARAQADERQCPGAEVTLLTSFDDVTARVAEARGDAAKRQEIISGIEKQCREETRLRCQIVTLYRGGQHWLYRYKVWNDVRLVWAPESRLGFFGGDQDNFVYPRFNLDAAIVRAYENGKPVETPHWLKFSREGVKDGEPVFAVGNPGSTDRALTAAELNFLRMQWYPIRVANADDAQSTLTEWGKKSAENQRRANEALLGIQNTLKAVRGENRALNVERLHQTRRGDDATWKGRAEAFRAKGEFQFRNGPDPWASIARAAELQHQYAFDMTATELPPGSLMRLAFDLVALGRESARPSGEVIRAYRESARPMLRNQLQSPRQWHRDLETVRLEQKIEEAMGYLGMAHPFVARMMGDDESPQAAATRLISGTRLDDREVRRALLEGGNAAIDASSDQLVALMRDLYPMWRAVRVRDQQEVEALKEAAHDDIARLKFHALGTTIAPDATATLRLTFGKVAGFDRDGIANPWTTSFFGLYDRNLAFGNKPPFDLPDNWLAARDKLKLDTPFNMVTTVDIIGGSSGSPLVNAKGELVGVMFDGNLDGLGNRFQYQERNARALAVDVRAITEALDKVYGARELLAELTAHWSR